MIAVSIPAAEPPAARSPDKGHTVFRVEVRCDGRRHTLAKRYSEFQALHKRIKKTCKVPDFPPSHVPNWMPKVLEQRRQRLELYLRGVLFHNKELPQDVLDFLKLRRGQDPPPRCPPAAPQHGAQRGASGPLPAPQPGSAPSPRPVRLLSSHPAPQQQEGALWSKRALCSKSWDGAGKPMGEAKGYGGSCSAGP
ncbi:sorting nexin-22 isoform X1 [Apus apus]|uniref:sorting nexin-22 isoform X1 n=1 Tax=Apus apus TaxID=8895 RepID=UPI0021F839EC|nr:sorting nexin-22 isoform X1 [Apus apus]